MIISVAGGKGGAGKTMVATSLALSLTDKEEVQFLDCDVGQPDAHIFLKPQINRRESVSIPVPKLDEEKCTYCGKCGTVCAYNAIVAFAKNVLTFPELCHGCGACSYLCHKGAVTEEKREIGAIELGSASGIDFAQGRLHIGEVMVLPIIKKVKEQAKHKGIVIVDVSTGTSSPAVEAVRDSNFCILVTEPTPAGLSAFVRSAKMLKKLNIPYGAVVNFNGVGDSHVEEYCSHENIAVLMSIPLSTDIARFYSRGITLVEGMPLWKGRFIELIERVRGSIGERDSRHKR